ELEMRRNKALEDLSAYLEKGGIVGVRANMLAGEIYYSVKDFKNSAKCWTSAAAKGKKSYTAPLAYFNAAVSYENINDLDNAEKYYKYAVSAKDFLMASHAEFSLGRVREAKGDTDGAIEAYRSLLGKNPDTSWGNLAKTRLIALGAE
ncbi:tetratricopeptide repeat protein, partial [Treponema porcinum]